MEILNNTNLICCFITFILGAMFMLATLCIVAISKDKEPRNKEPRNNVHFYVARNKDRKLFLYLGKPIRYATMFCGSVDEGVYIMTHNYFKNFGLNENDYDNLKWEDEPVEVFINMKDN